MTFSRCAAALCLVAALALCALQLSAADQGKFSYGKQRGHKYWTGTCATGKEQSPLNIVDSAKKAKVAVDTLRFTYREFTGANVTNSGHGPTVLVPPGNVLVTTGPNAGRWQLIQYHFHTPSENALDNRYAPIEAHLVHKNLDTGALAVVGVMMEAPVSRAKARSSVWNSALSQALSLVPRHADETSGPHRLARDTFTSLIPGSSKKFGRSIKRRHVHFDGSLTTPPCTEGLSWYVLLDAAQVHAAQVLAFQRLLGKGLTLDFNARPVAKLYGRQFD